VGSYPSNGFGLSDMHGNVWEWCQDQWHDNYEGAPTDGSAWEAGGVANRRVLRGGSWYGVPGLTRSTNRGRFTPDDRDGNLGFRVVCSSLP
jgi:formylglycine-generating enzyme required for sulfatase activity